MCDAAYIFHTHRSFRGKHSWKEILNKKNTSWNLISKTQLLLSLIIFREKINNPQFIFSQCEQFRTGLCVGLSPDPEVHLIRCWGGGLCVMTRWNNWIFDLRAAWKLIAWVCHYLSSCLLPTPAIFPTTPRELKRNRNSFSASLQSHGCFYCLLKPWWPQANSFEWKGQKAIIRF